MTLHENDTLKAEYWELIREGRFDELDKQTSKVMLSMDEWKMIEH